MMTWIYKNISLLSIILICLISMRRINISPESFSKKYRNLRDEEKNIYDKFLNNLNGLSMSIFLVVGFLINFFKLPKTFTLIHIYQPLVVI